MNDHPLTVRVRYEQRPDGTYEIVIYHDFDEARLSHYSEDILNNLSVAEISYKIKGFDKFRLLIEQDKGFYMNDKWCELPIPLGHGDKCCICGLPYGWSGNSLTMFRNKPHCTLCKMAIENRESGKNIRP